jgi:hypothetical protein
MVHQGSKRHRIVSKRLRAFFAALTAELATGGADLWAKVESRLTHKRPSVPFLPSQQQPQPLQQQQSKTEPDDKE